MRTTSLEVATYIVEQLNDTIVDGLDAPIVCNYGGDRDKKEGHAAAGGRPPRDAERPQRWEREERAPRWSGGGALGPPGDGGKGGGGKGAGGKGGKGDAAKGGKG